MSLNLDTLRAKLPALEQVSEKVESYDSYLGVSFVDSALVTVLNTLLAVIQDLTELDVYQKDQIDPLKKEASRNIFVAKMLLGNTKNPDLKTQAADDILEIETALEDSHDKALVDSAIVHGSVSTGNQNVSGFETISLAKDKRIYIHRDVANLVGETKDGKDLAFNLLDNPYFDNQGLWDTVTNTLMSFSVKYNHKYNSDYKFYLTYNPHVTDYEDALQVEILEPDYVSQKERQELSNSLRDIFFDYFSNNNEFGQIWKGFIDHYDLKEDKFLLLFQSKRQEKEMAS